MSSYPSISTSSRPRRGAGASRERSRHENLLGIFAAKDLGALIDAAFPVLHATVMCDFATAFYRSSANGLLKERDSRGRKSSPAFMRRYVELTPALPLALANPGIKVLTTRAALPRSARELRQSAFYLEIMRRQGWRHGVALCFWGDPRAESPIFVASVYRTEKRRDFSTREVAALERVHPFLDCAVNRVREREAASTVRDAMAAAMGKRGRGVVIVDRAFHVVHADKRARELCAAWASHTAAAPPDSGPESRTLPAELTAACRDLRRTWESAVRTDPDAAYVRASRTVSSSVRRVAASVTMVCSPAAGLGEPMFVIELTDGVAPSLSPTSSAPLLRKLTVVERSVALVLAEGCSNQEIADRLGKSVYAVKFLLHRIFNKTGVPHRTALMAALRRPRT